MKFFGWGKSKDPQPQTVLQQANKPDARNGIHGPLDRCKSLSSMGSIMPGRGCTTTTNTTTVGIRKQQGLFGVDEESYLHSSASMPKVSTSDVADSEEKLQDTIRFVFSHEREGLLAIGTFALEQLQSIRNTIDGHQKTSTPEDGLDSSASALDDMMQSSDDEDQLQRSWLAARKTCDLPVFGDSVDTSGVQSEAKPAPRSFDHDNSKALALYNPNPDRNANPSSVKPIVLLTALPPEIRRALDPASALLYGKSFLPHWTDAVPPPILAKPPAPFVDEDYYSSRLCGLFSRKKSLKSQLHYHQGEIVPVDGEEKKRMIPIELAAQETKKSLLKFTAPGVPSIGKLAKLWRASCRQSTARIAPERKPNPVKDLASKDRPGVTNGVASGEVFTTPVPQIMRPSGRLPVGACSPKVAEFRKRVQMHERMTNAPGELRDGGGSSRDDYGHWIKDDEDFVVLEM